MLTPNALVSREKLVFKACFPDLEIRGGKPSVAGMAIGINGNPKTQ